MCRGNEQGSILDTFDQADVDVLTTFVLTAVDGEAILARPEQSLRLCREGDVLVIGGPLIEFEGELAIQVDFDFVVVIDMPMKLSLE
jgi:hypothetical protein